MLAEFRLIPGLNNLFDKLIWKYPPTNHVVHGQNENCDCSPVMSNTHTHTQPHPHTAVFNTVPYESLHTVHTAHCLPPHAMQIVHNHISIYI